MWSVFGLCSDLGQWVLSWIWSMMSGVYRLFVMPGVTGWSVSVTDVMNLGPLGMMILVVAMILGLFWVQLGRRVAATGA